MHILRCMCWKFCMKFQRATLKFHTKIATLTSQYTHCTDIYFSLWFTISWNCDGIIHSETALWLAGGAYFTEIVNLLWPGDGIWRHRSWSSLVREMDCCYYLNQGSLVIKGIQWHYPKTNFLGIAQDIKSKSKFEKIKVDISFTPCQCAND